MSEFSDKYAVFNPNAEANAIADEQLVEFANLVKGTPNEDLVAYKDPKVQELVDFITAAIICENNRINDDPFPIQISRRYKADDSLKKKMEEWAMQEDKDGMQISDYLGLKVIPESEHSIFTADGDPRLQKMIDKREKYRSFIAEKYKNLSEWLSMTFMEYRAECEEVITALCGIFPKEATDRKEYYRSLSSLLEEDYLAYADMVEDANEPMSLAEISELTSVNIKKLLNELTLNYPNEVMLYKLKRDLMNTFENSEVIRALGISVSGDPFRTKTKSTKNGYRSEFIGLDLKLRLEDGREISLPIECQVQTQEQYRDGNIGYSAHTKLPNKRYKLKNVPRNTKGRYTDSTGYLAECREFLSHIMHISPSFAIAKTGGDDFEVERTIITPYDLYESFRKISRIPKDNPSYKAYTRYLHELYAEREHLFPTGDSLLPKYITLDEIPNPSTDYTRYNRFFNELRSSLKKTFSEAFKKQEQIATEAEFQIIDDEAHGEH